MSRGRDAEYTEYVAARLSSLRRLAGVLCGDWQRADDLVQATLSRAWARAHVRMRRRSFWACDRAHSAGL